jgi:hypothetical protein
MFRPKWPSSGVQFVVFQEFPAHCNVVITTRGRKPHCSEKQIPELQHVYTWRWTFRPKHLVKLCPIKEQRTTWHTDGAETLKSDLHSATGRWNITLWAVSRESRQVLRSIFSGVCSVMHIQVAMRSLALHRTQPALYNYIRYVEDRHQTWGQIKQLRVWLSARECWRGP